MRFTCHARASLATTNLIGISRVIRSRLNICRGADGRVLPRPGDAIPPAGCFTRRSLPPIYIRGTRPPPTADETDTESEQEDRDDNESDHSIRPVTEREQEDRDEKLRATNLFKRPPMILGGPSGDSRARTMQVL